MGVVAAGVGVLVTGAGVMGAEVAAPVVVGAGRAGVVGARVAAAAWWGS